MEENGLGIMEFFEGKTILITGATGLVGKAIVEKFLRSVPKVEKIYLLINSRTSETASDRWRKEILGADLFSALRDSANFDNLIRKKVVPLCGNVSKCDLGIHSSIATKIAKEIDIIVNSAGNTNFHERYDISFGVNTRGISYLLNFAKQCPKLKLFTHISTALHLNRNAAYVTRGKEGITMENPLSLTNESVARFIEQENEIIQSMLAHSEKKEVATNMKNLGLERARVHGMHDTYSLTKVMGEMQLNEFKGKTPIVILRPSIIESTFNEPFPGWIEGIRMLDPIIVKYGRGVISGFIGAPEVILDVVPLDMVVNSTLAAIAKHGSEDNNDVHIYHMTSSSMNPFSFQLFADVTNEYFQNNPHINKDGSNVVVKKYEFFASPSDFVKKHCGQNTREMVRKRTEVTNQKLENFATIYKPYMLFMGRFDSSNLNLLWKRMSDEEKKVFAFDVGKIYWRDYFMKCHIPGLRKHAWNESGMEEQTDAIISRL